MAKEPWDPTDRKYEWSIEEELLQMINRGRFRAADRGSDRDILIAKGQGNYESLFEY